jgi:hypothetical protein
MVIGRQHLILKENSINSSLTLSVGNHFVSISILDTSSQKLLLSKHKNFKNFVKTELLDSEVDIFLNENNVNDFNIEDVKLIQENDFYVLVPEELYSEKEKSTYLKYNTVINKDDFICCDDIDQLNLKNVFIPYVNINNYMVDKFKNINYYHFNSLLIKKAYSNREKDENFIVYVNEKKIKIIIFNEEGLLFFNSYSIDSNLDAIYYILLTLKEHELEIISTQINFIIDCENSDLISNSKRFFNKIKIINDKLKINF